MKPGAAIALLMAATALPAQKRAAEDHELQQLRTRLAATESARAATESARADLARQLFISASELRRQNMAADNARADLATAERESAESERRRLESDHARALLAEQLAAANIASNRERSQAVNSSRLQESITAASKATQARAVTTQQAAALAAENARDAADEAARTIALSQANLERVEALDKRTAAVQKAVGKSWYEDSATVSALCGVLVALFSLLLGVLNRNSLEHIGVNVNGNLSKLLARNHALEQQSRGEEAAPID